MWLVNKTYLSESEASSQSINCDSITEMRIHKTTEDEYEVLYIPIYKTYELAVKDWPCETIIEIKYNG